MDLATKCGSEQIVFLYQSGFEFVICCCEYMVRWKNLFLLRYVSTTTKYYIILLKYRNKYWLATQCNTQNFWDNILNRLKWLRSWTFKSRCYSNRKKVQLSWFHNKYGGFVSLLQSQSTWMLNHCHQIHQNQGKIHEECATHKTCWIFCTRTLTLTLRSVL